MICIVFVNADGEVYINIFELLQDGGDLNIHQVLSCMYKTVVLDYVVLIKGQSMIIFHRATTSSSASCVLEDF